MRPRFRRTVLLMLLLSACSDQSLDVAAPEEKPVVDIALSVSSADVIVTSTADAGPGSLRQAILDAPVNAITSITFDASLINGTITLSSGELLIEQRHIVINATGVNVTIDANLSSRIFNVAATGTLELERVTLRRGSGAPDGGAILNAGTLLMLNSTVRNSIATRWGGGIHSTGVIKLANSTLRENLLDGPFWHRGAGLMVENGSANIQNTRIVANRWPDDDGGDGAAISVAAGTVLMHAGEFGGAETQNGPGLHVMGGTVTVDSVIVSGTRASGPRGPIYLTGGTLTLTRSRLFGNVTQSNGAAIYNNGGTLIARYNELRSNRAALHVSGSSDLNDNWWGCNTGPNTPGCTTTLNVAPSTWMVAQLIAEPSAVDLGGKSKITFEASRNSAGQSIRSSDLTIFAGRTVNFINPILGTVSPASMIVEEGGRAVTTFTANATQPGTGVVNARITDLALSTVQIQVGPENRRPVVNPGAPQTVECTGALTSVTLDGSASYDPDGDPLTFQWFKGTLIATGPTPTVPLPLGAYEIRLRVTDGRGGQSEMETEVHIKDTKAPIVTLNGAAEVQVERGSSYTELGATANDWCAGVLQPQISGSVNTGVVGDYTITYSATDEAGNVGSAARLVKVRVTNNRPVVRISRPPQVECTGATTSVFLDGSASYDPDGDPITYQWQRGSTIIGTGPTVTVPLPIGHFEIILKVRDSKGLQSELDAEVRVDDTKAPVITLNGPAEMQVEQGSAYTEQGASAVDACEGGVAVQKTGSVNANAEGDYVVTFTATDRQGNSATVTRLVRVRDTTAPAITIAAAPLNIWPPNHKYVTVSLSALGISVRDMDPNVRPENVRITKVTSDEADDGYGDGDTAHDMVVARDGRSVQLRAERDGSGNGRVYLVHLAVTDRAGNTGRVTYRVNVPRNANGTAIMDAVRNSVAGYEE